MEPFHNHVRTDTGRETTQEGAKRDDGHVPQLATCHKVLAGCRIKVVPEGLYVVTNVTARISRDTLPTESKTTHFMVMSPTPVRSPIKTQICQNSGLLSKAKPVISTECECADFLLVASASPSIFPWPESSVDDSVEVRSGASSSARGCWQLIGRYRKEILTDLLLGKSGGAVYAPVGSVTMNDVRVAPRSLIGRKHRIASTTPVVHHNEKRDRNKNNERGTEREHKKQAGSVAREGNAGYKGIKESAEPKRCQRKCRRRPAVCWPVECRWYC
jgi:hypothetical protein